MAGIDTSFFEKSADLWKDNETCNNSIEIISSLAIANDGTERGVKLSHDYICTAKKEGNLQSILQVVENERNKSSKGTKSVKVLIYEIVAHAYLNTLSTVVLISSFLSSCHEKAAEALRMGRIQTRLRFALISEFSA